jgi:Holliday junction DNA helicase RuvB
MTMREPVLQSDAATEEEDRDLRPQRMRDMVGQRDVYARLEIAVDAAGKRGEPLGHILFDGPPGLGKTTFANCIPRELNVPLITASGPAIKAPKDLLPFLTNMEERAIFFIDEIHRLPKAVEEYLYTAMEDFRLDIILGEGINARTINMRIKPFTPTGPSQDRIQGSYDVWVIAMHKSLDKRVHEIDQHFAFRAAE